MQTRTPSGGHPSRHDTADAAWLGRLGTIYLLFIVYGSLLPFNWNDLAFAIAWKHFQNIPLLTLGVGSRADLVANLLLYIPLGFLSCGWLSEKSRRPSVRLLLFALSLLFSAAVSLCIEFTQEFFPPRTVSLNDILAEITGAALGIALWPIIGSRLMRLARVIFQGGTNARLAALITYALAYALLSLFPYDFLLDTNEWQAHLSSGKVGWLFAPDCGSMCAWKLIPEMLLFAPLGMLGVLACGRFQHISLLLAAAIGTVSGAMIEGLQLTIVSGISQGASVVSRAAGMILGVWLAQSAQSVDWRQVRQFARGAVALCMLPYLAVLAWLNHWFSTPWLGLAEGVARVGDINFLPFYYHYYTAEAVAMVSLLFQAGLYLPVGTGLWLWQYGGRTEKPAHSFVWLAVTAGTIASAIEVGKLFISSQHPDPTNILIAATAAMAAYQLLHLLLGPIPDQAAMPAGPASAPTDTARHPHRMLTAIGATALCIAIAAAMTSPLGATWVLPPLLMYAALLWWQPHLWLTFTLALLPLLDLTPWTGRLYWTEYDSLLLATTGIGYLHLSSGAHPALRKPARLLLAMFALSAAISLGVGLWPLAAFDQNAFASYTNSYNGLRAAKGLLFAIVFIPLLASEWNDPDRAARRLASGMTLGLAVEVLYVLWERVTFSGLFNFETDYRITGSFPAMHIGGAYIEGYLVTALPFVALWAWQQRRMATTALAAVLYGLGAYCVMVTFSRGGQVAFLLATFILLLGFARLALHNRVRRFAGVSAVILIAGISVAIAWPVFSGKFSQSRLATIGQDIVTRTDHWSDALHILHKQNASLFGVGLGTFPSAYLWSSNESSRPSTYAFIAQNGNTFLRLGSGETLYFEQPVAVMPEQKYTLSMDLRSSASNAALTVPVCEKALLYSFTCAWTTLQIKAPPGQWGHYESDIQTHNFGPPNSSFPRPVKLSMFNGSGNTVVDVDNVALCDASGNNLVRNGDFSTGMHHWFFSTDSHLPWHVKNLYLHVLFEQGWIGLVCFMALIAYAATRWLSRARNNDPLSLTLLTSLSAFLVVGVVDSLIDETRLGFLFYLLLIAGLVADGQSTGRKSPNRITNPTPVPEWR